MMRLKKAEKDKYLQIVKNSRNGKIISFRKDDDLERAWRKLKDDHFSRLRLDLDHVGQLRFQDKMSVEIRGGGLTTKDYIQHYSKTEIELIKLHLQQAEHSLQYLRNLILEEEQRRSNTGGKA
jgi:hypothetical protein